MTKKRSKNVNKKEKNFLFENYKKSWRYLNESKNYIFIVIGLFILFLLMGFISPIFFADKITEMVKGLLNRFAGVSGLKLVWMIFANNVNASLFGLVFGLFLGIFPVILTVVNGYLVGFVSNKVVSEVGYTSLWRLLPHGIFELPAVFISFGLGIKLGMFIFDKKPGKELLYRIKGSLRVILFIILPLLFIAAVIEGVLISFFS